MEVTIMDFYVADSYTNGSGQRFASKSAFLAEVSKMIDDCEANGGTFFDLLVSTDASCFAPEV
jgi:hypothetical protein